ncbi:tRNA (adenosine(37)-N6)-threonylcarbamoyltransferase complex ATPase subunit type 1 TsaE [Patescibacteria group bacterium]|nr:tRNA (adenosine(37)-N6)-threonylcarbamoyltransferase complex ATPase subunit type 1 TsaE [Patescibacteria group bacterium]MBU1895478.1 tRNA (adenosine(37)-N6)-threonylcarbamoyltransferase complex ATPase subunit type 1 TsaE [Patescibacteria group bacterium]
MKYTTSSAEQTIKLGKKIASKFKGGDVVLLHGDLGTGKTTLVKGIADYFGIEPNDVVSPTFTLMQVYPTNNEKRSTIRQLVHIDTYRLETQEQLVEIGIEDYLGDQNTICIIEWPEKLGKLLVAKKILNIKIEHDGENERKIIRDDKL